MKAFCRSLRFDPTPGPFMRSLVFCFELHSPRGESVFHLQKVLGHSTLEMTRPNSNLMTEDLQGEKRIFRLKPQEVSHKSR